MINYSNIEVEDALNIALNNKHPLDEDYALDYIYRKNTFPNNFEYKFSKKEFLKKLFINLTNNCKTDIEKVKTICKYLQNRVVHTWECITVKDKMITCPIFIILNRMGQCGQVNRTMIDLLEPGGYKGRVVQLVGHVCCEIFINNKWCFFDCDELNNEFITDDNNNLVSTEDIICDPLKYIQKINSSLDPSNIIDLIQCKNRFNHIYSNINLNKFDSWNKNIYVWNYFVYGKRFEIDNNLPYDIKRLISLFLRNIECYEKHFQPEKINFEYPKVPYYTYKKNKSDLEKDIFYGW